MNDLAIFLSAREIQRLAACEADIERGPKLIVEALLIIRDERLYRADHATFEDYCQQRWGLSKPYVYRLMDHGSTIRGLIEAPPATEQNQMVPIGTKNTLDSHLEDEEDCEDYDEFQPNGATDWQETVSNLSEGATREIRDLPIEQQVQVVETAAAVSNGKPTAKAMRKVREKVAPKPPKAGREISTGKIVDGFLKKHVSPLVRGIDKLAEINGGRGSQYTKANAALNDLIHALKAMRGGQR